MIPLRALLDWRLLVTLLVVGLLARECHHQRQIGARDALLRESRRELAQLQAEKRRVDSIYVRDTLRLFKVRTSTDTLLKVRVDSFIRVDTVQKIVERERQACDAVISACERRVAVRDSIIGTLKEQNTLLAGNQPSFWSRFGLTAGYGLTATANGEVHHGPQVGVSIRVLP